MPPWTRLPKITWTSGPRSLNVGYRCAHCSALFLVGMCKEGKEGSKGIMRASRNILQKSATALTSIALSAIIGLGGITPALAETIDNESGGTSEVNTTSGIDPTMDQAADASISDRYSIVSSPYAVDPTEGRTTFGVVNMKKYNYYLAKENQGVAFYLTFSMDASGNVYARLVNRDTGALVEEMQVTTSDGKFSALDQYKDIVLQNAETTWGSYISLENVYPNIKLTNNADGSSFVTVNWSQGNEYINEFTYILDTQGRESADDELGVSSISMYVPIEVDQNTYYWAVNTNNSTYDASNPSAYVLDDTETLLSS